MYLLQKRDEALKVFHNFKLEVENETNSKIKTLHSDRGGEYVSKSFLSFCRENEIKHLFIMSYTS